MTETIISLVSILIGIIGANLTGIVFKRYSHGIIGNTIAGVFGSVFLIKSFGRLGFDPLSIMQSGNANISLFVINSIVSFCGGAIAVILLKKIKNKINRKI